jgi:hypothetical protein
MMDTSFAVKWSKDKLDLGGWFVMDDFVGPTRWQWTDYNLQIAEKVLSILPPRLVKDPENPGKMLPKTFRRPDASRLCETDPSEAADSDNIIPSIKSHFANAIVENTGGWIYHLALRKALANFEEEDESLLESLLILDEALAKAGHTHYAVAIAQKEPDGQHS